MTFKKEPREPHDWVQPFLDALTDLPNVTRAAKVARVSRKTVYEYRHENAAFATAWDKALEVGIGAMEDEAMRRAVEGTNKPLVSAGKIVGTVREYSDTLMIFLLKAHRPDKYNVPQRQQVSGPDGGAVVVRFTGLESVADDDLDSLITD